MPETGPTILLAEDNAADVYLVREALRAHNLADNLHVVADGEAAIRFIEEMEKVEDSPSLELALLDLNMPKRSGLEVLAHLRRGAKCGQIPVVMISSSRGPSKTKDTPYRDADRFFTKPSDYDEFMRLGEIVSHLLQANRSSST